jgi:hypothetical protein
VFFFLDSEPLDSNRLQPPTLQQNIEIPEQLDTSPAPDIAAGEQHQMPTQHQTCPPEQQQNPMVDQQGPSQPTSSKNTVGTSMTGRDTKTNFFYKHFDANIE